MVLYRLLIWVQLWRFTSHYIGLILYLINYKYIHSPNNDFSRSGNVRKHADALDASVALNFLCNLLINTFSIWKKEIYVHHCAIWISRNIYKFSAILNIINRKRIQKKMCQIWVIHFESKSKGLFFQCNTIIMNI